MLGATNAPELLLLAAVVGVEAVEAVAVAVAAEVVGVEAVGVVAVAVAEEVVVVGGSEGAGRGEGKGAT
jgi:hypothetical protein